VITRFNIDTGRIEQVAVFHFRDRMDGWGHFVIAANVREAQATLREHGYEDEAHWPWRVAPWRSDVVRMFQRQESELECEGK